MRENLQLLALGMSQPAYRDAICATGIPAIGSWFYYTVCIAAIIATFI